MRALRVLRFCSAPETLDASVKRVLELKNLDPRLQGMLHAVLQKPDKVEEILKLKPECNALHPIPPPPSRAPPGRSSPVPPPPPPPSVASSSSVKASKPGVAASSKKLNEDGGNGERVAKAYFLNYWSPKLISQGLRSGDAFEGVLRVSAFHTDRAFVQLRDGTSVRVKGFIGRNRAMNGDSVIAAFDKKDEATDDTKTTKEDVKAETSKAQDQKFTKAKLMAIEAVISVLRECAGRKMAISALGRCEAVKDAKQPGRGNLVALLEKCPEIELCVIDGQLHAVLNEPEPVPLAVGEDRVCKVVSIVDRVQKSIVGQLKSNNFQPRDSRLPAFDVAPEERPQSNENDLLIVEFQDWARDSFTPKGRIVGVLGPQGDAMSEADAIASWYNFVPQEHSAEMEEEALGPKTEDMERKDLRGLRVFTVDPPHAKDLDDALSVELLSNGRVRIGVHIADVTHYVKPGGLIDNEARKRLVTLYLVNKVYPMLPRCLSDSLCSLLPNVDRNAFSVFYVINKDGTLAKNGQEFMKSTIHSCCRWSYKEVDDALASDAKGDETLEDLRVLHKVTRKRRETRLSAGGVALSPRAELRFELDDTGSPIGLNLAPKVESPSHTLIEELMVLCNHVVAQKLLRGQGGLLRMHSEAEKGPETILKLLGDEKPPDDVPRTTRGLLDWVETNMPQAYETICFAALQDKGFEPAEYKILTQKQKHWALNLPSYLHFTSPIRRYADVVVHRMLQDQLMHRKPAKSEKESLKHIAETCNTKKREAFDASTDSMMWHFGEYLRLYCQEGLKTEVVLTKIIADENEGRKPAVELYVPMVGQIKSVALEHLNLTVDDARKIPLLVPRQALIVPSTDTSRNWTIRGLE
eukprot:GEMP01009356.1.p1 GENE.GEMP01009356.1~~GEMP01009356.1.p1  ORF type:complete len:873 (+),score=190.13 GEMP01009356.1:30-2621(+)